MRLQDFDNWMNWLNWPLYRVARSGHRLYREEATGRILTIPCDHGQRHISQNRVDNVRQHLRRLSQQGKEKAGGRW